jgi:GNAT superfamily N-acetyltransferase
MDVKKKEIGAKGVKLFIMEDNKEIARAYLYILKNDLHQEPFGFMEDVFVHPDYRQGGLGKKIVQALIDEAKERNCYKIICTSRHGREVIHKMYENLGFKNYGIEFRQDIP